MKMVQEVTRYSYSYYGRQIESRIWCIERHHFQWLWVTLSQDFKVTVLYWCLHARSVCDSYVLVTNSYRLKKAHPPTTLINLRILIGRQLLYSLTACSTFCTFRC